VLTITDKEFTQLGEYIKRNYGIRLGPEKKALVIGRLNHVLAQKGFDNFTEFFEYVMTDATGNEAVALIDKITTNHTYFMREAAHFHYFQNSVLPHLKTTVKDKDLRIWSAGCSSGEEPYTLAMLIDEFFGVGKAEWDTDILATDISGRALERAATGVYANADIASLPERWKKYYFRSLDGETSVVTDKIRSSVIFRKFNLMETVFPFKRKFHVIFCRNVMIYFDNHTKNQLVNKFYQLTEPGGYLFIGHSESLNREETPYKYIMPAVYRKA